LTRRPAGFGLFPPLSCPHLFRLLGNGTKRPRPPLRAVSFQYCYWLLRAFNSMAKNVTRNTERLLMMQSNNKELNSAVSRIQSNNKELNSAVSRMQFQISRLKRKKKRMKTTDLAAEPTDTLARLRRLTGPKWQAVTYSPSIMRIGHSQEGVWRPVPLPKIYPSLQSILSSLMGSGSPEREWVSRINWPAWRLKSHEFGALAAEVKANKPSAPID